MQYIFCPAIIDLFFNLGLRSIFNLHQQKRRTGTNLVKYVFLLCNSSNQINITVAEYFFGRL